ncbi:uncharacterized protein [Miscanthus floridulus]|uniref:uncharacterized protein n=1 Tax=Miscanthus floridulus TaxID=154761 RepID=UPI00345A53A8
MRLGGGKKHGRLWIADGAIDSTTVPSLDVLRARSTSSSQPIRPRPSPSLQRVDALEAELQAQKLVVEAQSAQLQAQREAFAAQERRMQEMEAFMRSVQQGSVPLPLAAPPPPTPTATPLPSAGSNNPANASPNEPSCHRPLF